MMVKPAMPYLDVIAKARETFNVPVAAYNVSGEYAMLKAAAQNEWLDGQRAAMEVLTAIKRAGADLIISYHAKEAARLLVRRPTRSFALPQAAGGLVQGDVCRPPACGRWPRRRGRAAGPRRS